MTIPPNNRGDYIDRFASVLNVMFLRAVARRSGATPEQIAQIRQALGDRQKIEQLTLFMRKERAHRLIRVQDLGKWIAENWEVILRILGIAIMFLKEAPPEDVMILRHSDGSTGR